MEELIASGLVEGVFDLTPGEITRNWSTDRSAPGRSACAQPGSGASRKWSPLEGSILSSLVLQTPCQSPTAGAKLCAIRQPSPWYALCGGDGCSRRDYRRAALRVKGPAAVILPATSLRLVLDGGPTAPDPQADRAFIRALKKHISPKVEVIEIDAHLNDPELARKQSS